MKKLIALLLAMMMVCSVAFAETTATDANEEAADYEEQDVLNFDIAMDELPAGYTMEVTEYDFGKLYTFSAGEDDVLFNAGVVYSEPFDGYTLVLDDLTEEEVAQMTELLTDGYAEPVVTYDKTSHGTDVIIVDENIEDGDYGEIFTVYQGFMITICLVKDDTLTADDYALGLKLLSDMWIVTAE